jgi:hypothetical protein
VNIRTIILAFVALHLLAACTESTGWPPNLAHLMHIFDQQKATFIVIEKEMASDGLTRMGPVIYSQTRSLPIASKLPSSRNNKYAELFESTQMFLDVTRNDRATAFELLLQNVGSRLYLSRFIHISSEVALPGCVPAMQRASCGVCTIELESEWLLEYSWFPADPETEAREC